MPNENYRLVERDLEQGGWVVRKGQGQPPLWVAATREEAENIAILGLQGQGGGTLEVHAYDQATESFSLKTTIGGTPDASSRSKVGSSTDETAAPRRQSPNLKPERIRPLPVQAEPAQPAPPKSRRVESPAAAASDQRQPAPVPPVAEQNADERYPSKTIFAIAAFATLWAWLGRPEDAIITLLEDWGISEDTKAQMLLLAIYAAPATIASCIAFVYCTRDKKTDARNKVAVVLALFTGASFACAAIGLGYPVDMTTGTDAGGHPAVRWFIYVLTAYMGAYGIMTTIAACLLGVWAAMAAENRWGRHFV
ncbi:hypothetical protein M1D93_13210 [Arthrobacter sp. Z1-9]